LGVNNREEVVDTQRTGLENRLTTILIRLVVMRSGGYGVVGDIVVGLVGQVVRGQSRAVTRFFYSL
jgi:hypothetical protein